MNPHDSDVSALEAAADEVVEEYVLPLLGAEELLDRKWRLELVVDHLLDHLRDLDVYLDGAAEDAVAPTGSAMGPPRLVAGPATFGNQVLTVLQHPDGRVEVTTVPVASTHPPARA